MPYCSINGRELWYEDVGEGFPVVISHSLLLDAASVNALTSALSAQYRCIVPEMWGHGRSACIPDFSYQPRHLADDYRILLDALGVGPCAIVGIAEGGAWAGYFAVQFPQRVVSMALLDTDLGTEPDCAVVRYAQLIDVVEKEQQISPAVQEALVPSYFSATTIRQRPALIHTFREALSRIPVSNIASVIALCRGILQRESLLGQLGAVTAPVLAIIGQEQAAQLFMDVERTAKALPNVRLHHVPQAGHLSHWEAPETVVTAIRRFLDEHITVGVS